MIDLRLLMTDCHIGALDKAIKAARGGDRIVGVSTHNGDPRPDDPPNHHPETVTVWLNNLPGESDAILYTENESDDPDVVAIRQIAAAHDPIWLRTNRFIVPADSMTALVLGVFRASETAAPVNLLIGDRPPRPVTFKGLEALIRLKFADPVALRVRIESPNNRTTDEFIIKAF